MTDQSVGRPLVSVVIPAYNHEKFIKPAIDSVLHQTMDDFELIIIDDGSTDGTWKLIQSYDDPRIRAWTQENQDAFNTINRGLSLVRGHYISILNSDDIYERSRLEELVKVAEETGACCLFTDVIPISDTGEIFEDPEFGWNLWHQKNRAFANTAADLYTAFLHGNFMVTTSNLFMTAESCRKVGKFCSSRYFHDYDYILRMLLNFPSGVHYLKDRKLLRYRIHPGNTLSEAAIRGRIEEQQMILHYMQQRIDGGNVADIETGGKRLITLGEELHEVRTALMNDEPEIGVRRAAKLLARGLKTWVLKRAGRGNRAEHGTS